MNEAVEKLVDRLLLDAELLKIEIAKEPKNPFYDGQRLAVEIMFITVKNTIISLDLDPKDYGLDFEPEQYFTMK